MWERWEEEGTAENKTRGPGYSQPDWDRGLGLFSAVERGREEGGKDIGGKGVHDVLCGWLPTQMRGGGEKKGRGGVSVGMT